MTQDQFLKLRSGNRVKLNPDTFVRGFSDDVIYIVQVRPSVNGRYIYDDNDSVRLLRRYIKKFQVA